MPSWDDATEKKLLLTMISRILTFSKSEWEAIASGKFAITSNFQRTREICRLVVAVVSAMGTEYNVESVRQKFKKLKAASKIQFGDMAIGCAEADETASTNKSTTKGKRKSEKAAGEESPTKKVKTEGYDEEIEL